MRLRCLAALLVIGLAPLAAQPSALSVNPASREEVRQFYRAIYFASENVPMAWTGNYATGDAGDTSAAFKEATRLRINFYRALVGVPADITFDSTYSAKSQRAALMMSGNKVLQHDNIPTSWTYYSADGAEAAGKANLALASAGPAAVNGYVIDSGDNNAAVGHRRWLFYPQTLRMGTGDVPGSGNLLPANAVWVLQQPPGSPGSFGTARPPTRTAEVTYPPAGFVPHTLVWPRWSFSHPDADYTAATVTMTRHGQPVAVDLEPLSVNPPAGEPTLVWVYDNKNTDDDTPHARPTADTAYVVNVNNVRIGTATRNFSYTVTVFDPDVASADATPVVVTGSTTPAIGASTAYAISKPTFASAFDWRAVQLSRAGKVYGAENGLDGLVATTTLGYDVVQSLSVANGRASYRLAHSEPRSDEILELPGLYFISATSALSFHSRLAIATAAETARVQVSTDDGESWIDLFRQAGTSSTDTDRPAPVEAAFVPRIVSLAAFAGRTIAIRLVFTITPAGAAFGPDATNTIGWFIDNLTLSNTQTVTATSPARIAAGNVFHFSPTLTGPVALQARGVIGGAYPLEWGPVLQAEAIAGDVPLSSSFLSNLSVRTTAGSGDNTLIVGFRVGGGSKRILVRGIGPALTTFGVAGALADPKLELFGASGKLTENDNWDVSRRAIFAAAGAFNLPESSRDAVLVNSLAEGSYTAQLSGPAGATGIALVELYDTARTGGGSRLVNLSARSQVGTGDNILVAGFTVSGTGPRSLLIRAIGPTLTAFGVSGVLDDPILELYDGSRIIGVNNDWNASAAATFTRVGAFSLTPNSRDAVLLVTLPPGSYTAQVSGVNNTRGVALIEVYELP